MLSRMCSHPGFFLVLNQYNAPSPPAIAGGLDLFSLTVLAYYFTTVIVVPSLSPSGSWLSADA